LFMSRLAVRAGAAGIYHRSHRGKVAGLEFRDAVANTGDAAHDFVTRHARINCVVPFAMRRRTDKLQTQRCDRCARCRPDHAGRSARLRSFKVLFVCTSNIGSQHPLRPTRLPFTTLERAVISELHKFFRPELIGRFDEKIVFKPLSPDTQREIGRLVISEELDRLRQQGFDLSISDGAFEFLVGAAFTKHSERGP
jgi:hypothetical protein